MSALTSAELTAIRDEIQNDLLPDTCDILSVTETADGQGGVTQAWGTASASVACRLDMKQGREMTVGGAIQPYTRYMMSLPYDASVASTNRILHSGTTYAVKSVNANQSWIAVTRVELEKL